MARIPTTIITGFLGAGKTSMVRHLLQNAGGRRLAIIVNEFGDMGVDGALLKACDNPACEEEDILELANGCICCTVADDFVPTMEALLAREPRPDHILIETSGLAMPKPLIKAFNWPEIKANVTVDGVVTVVDSPAVADGLFAGDPEAVDAQRQADEELDHETPLEELFEEQLGSADLVVLNKIDLLPAEKQAHVKAEVEKHTRPGVHFVTASHGALSASVLLGLDAAAEDDLDSRHSHHDGVDEHEHDDFTSFVLPVPEQADLGRLSAQITALAEARPVYRVKGFVAVEGKALKAVVQAVGRRVQTYFDQPFGAGDARTGQLVIIGDHDLDPVDVATFFA